MQAPAPSTHFHAVSSVLEVYRALGAKVSHQTAPDLTARSKGFPADPVVPMQGTWVQSLVGELRPPCAMCRSQENPVLATVIWVGTYFPCFCCPKCTMVKTYLFSPFLKKPSPSTQVGVSGAMTWHDHRGRSCAHEAGSCVPSLWSVREEIRQ